MSINLPTGYRLKAEKSNRSSQKSLKCERALVLEYMTLTYKELYPQKSSFEHLRTTVEQYYSEKTPLWLVETAAEQSPKSTVGCLWMGNATDQKSGEYYAYIFLIFVDPAHRRRGIGRALIAIAEDWAKARGDRQIGLQVFSDNHRAIKLYQSAGFQTQSLSLIKTFTSTD